MYKFGYKNLSKIVMLTTILVILTNTILITIFYYRNQLENYDIMLKNIKSNNIKNTKKTLKDELAIIIKMIEYKYSKEDLQTIRTQNEIKQWLKSIPFDKEKSNYIFVYDELNLKGGDKFARMLINPNRPDIENKYISSQYKDINGFKFRKKFLDDINQKGDSVVTYAYKKTNDIFENKISYFLYYKPLNWIIAKGVYNSEINKSLGIKELSLRNRVYTHIKENLFIFMLFTFIAVLIAYFFSKKIEGLINEKEKKVKNSTKALALLNRELDNRVKKEVEKNKEQEQILMQKSKFIALGETINLIAHQWRQPISELNAIVLNIKLHHKMGKLTNDLMNDKSRQIDNVLEYMSKTIDDFRTFFKPQKKVERFNLNESISRVLDITKAMLEDGNIKIDKEIDTSLYIVNFQNEFEQVLLNILSNARDAMLGDKIEKPTVKFQTYKEKSQVYIKISDNAYGINEELIDKIFDPYFTTKDDANGTGIGLYMSKIIIEKNMRGFLDIQSDKKGSTFIISFSV